MKSQSYVRWYSSMTPARSAAFCSRSTKWRQVLTGGRSTASPASAAATRSCLFNDLLLPEGELAALDLEARELLDLDAAVVAERDRPEDDARGVLEGCHAVADRLAVCPDLVDDVGQHHDGVVGVGGERVGVLVVPLLVLLDKVLDLGARVAREPGRGRRGALDGR